MELRAAAVVDGREMNRITGGMMMTTCRRSILLLTLMMLLVKCACSSSQVEIDMDGNTAAAAVQEEDLSLAAAEMKKQQEEQQRPSYGVDVSWPMHHHVDVDVEEESKKTMENHHPSIATTIRDLAHDYGKFMSGCYDKYEWEACEAHEEERLALNLNQPPAMKNFTAAGYAKVQAPAKAYGILRDFFKKYYKQEQQQEEGGGGSSSQSQFIIPEEWGPNANVYVNHWEASTEMNHMDMYMSRHDKEQIASQVQSVLEQWSGVPLVETSMYGIRIYKRGSILSPHVDRLPLVISAIINVDQAQQQQGGGGGVDDDDNYEPWPLEVIGHDGIAVNITMSPGEMILYESHSVIHGRPFPLQADYFANVFLHFEPIGYTYEITQQLQSKNNEHSNPTQVAKAMYEASLAKHLNPRMHYDDDDDDDDPVPMKKNKSPTVAPSLQTPPYITGADETVRWRQEFVYYRVDRKEKKKPTKTIGATSAHVAAAAGDLATIKAEAAKNPDVLNKADENGWKPIHEAARGGRHRVVEYLIENGVDVNERTHNGEGGTPLWWAEQSFPEKHPVVQVLRKAGAEAHPPKPARDKK